MEDEDNMCLQKHPDRRTAREREREREKKGHELERTRGTVAFYQKVPAASIYLLPKHQDTNTHSCKLDIKFSHLFSMFSWSISLVTQVHLAEFESLGMKVGRRWSNLPTCLKNCTL